MPMNMIIRNINPELHRKLKIKAAEEGKTLQSLLVEILGGAVKGGGKKKE